jgi:hypothetical protein
MNRSVYINPETGPAHPGIDQTEAHYAHTSGTTIDNMTIRIGMLQFYHACTVYHVILIFHYQKEK